MGKNYSTEQRELALAYAPVIAEAIKDDSASNQSRQRALADLRSNRNPNLPLIICDLIKKTIKSANTPDFHKFNALDLFKELVDCENTDFWIQASQIILPRLAKIGLHRSEEKSMNRGETCLFEYSGRTPTNNKDQAGHFPLWEKNFFVFLLELFQIWSGDFPNFSLKYKNLPADYKQLYRALLVKGVTFPTEFTFMIPPIPMMPPPLPIFPPPPPIVETPAFVPPPVLPPVLPPVIHSLPPPPVEKKDFRNLKSAVSECVDTRNTIADAVMTNPNDPNLEFFFEVYENAAGVLEKDKDLQDLGSSAYQPQQNQLLQEVDRERDIAKKLLAAKHAYTKTKDPDSYQNQVVQIFQKKLNKRLIPVPVRQLPPPPVFRSPPMEVPPPRPPVVVATPPPPLVVPQSRIADSGFEMQSKRSALGQSNFAYDPGMLGMSITPEKVRRALDGPIMTLDRTLVQETVDKSSRCEVETKELRRQNVILKQKVTGLQKEIDEAEKESRNATEEAATTTRNNEKALGEVLVLRGRRDDLKDKLARKREELINLKNERANYGKESGERRTNLANTLEMLKKLKKLKEVELARYRSKFKQLERDYGQNLKAVDDNRTEKQNLLRSSPGITASVIDRTYRDASPLSSSHIGVKEPPSQSLSGSYIQRDVERLVALRTAGQSRPSAPISGTFGRGEGAQLMSDLNRDIDSLLKRTDSSLVTGGDRYRGSSPYSTRDSYISKYHLA